MRLEALGQRIILAEVPSSDLQSRGGIFLPRVRMERVDAERAANRVANSMAEGDIGMAEFVSRIADVSASDGYHELRPMREGPTKFGIVVASGDRHDGVEFGDLVMFGNFVGMFWSGADREMAAQNDATLWSHDRQRCYTVKPPARFSIVRPEDVIGIVARAVELSAAA